MKGRIKNVINAAVCNKIFIFLFGHLNPGPLESSKSDYSNFFGVEPKLLNKGAETGKKCGH